MGNSPQTLSQQDLFDLIQVREMLKAKGDPRAQKVDDLIQSQIGEMKSALPIEQPSVWEAGGPGGPVGEIAKRAGTSVIDMLKEQGTPTVEGVLAPPLSPQAIALQHARLATAALKAGPGAAAESAAEQTIPFPVGKIAREVGARQYPEALGTAALGAGELAAAGIVAEALPVRLSPQSAALKGYNLTLKAIGYGKGDFRANMKLAADSGHLREFASQAQPQTVYETARSLQDYMNNWEESTIGAAIKRHPAETISGTGVAGDILSLRNPNLERLFPEQTKALQSEAIRYGNEQIPLETARQALVKVNAMSRGLLDLNPADKAALESAQAAKLALDAVGQSLRQRLYGRLDDLGEKGIAQARKEHGALASLRDQVYDTIPKAEEAEAKKPSYWSVPGRSVSRHPLLTGGVVTAGFIHPGAAPALTVLPALEAARTFAERAATPNNLLRNALDAYRRGPQGINRPYYKPPTPPPEALAPPEDSSPKPPLPPIRTYAQAHPEAAGMPVPAAETAAPAPIGEEGPPHQAAQPVPEAPAPSPLQVALKARKSAVLVLNYLKNSDKYAPTAEAKAVEFVQRNLGIDISQGENVAEAEAGLKLLAAGKKAKAVGPKAATETPPQVNPYEIPRRNVGETAPQPEPGSPGQLPPEAPAAVAPESPRPATKLEESRARFEAAKAKRGATIPTTEVQSGTETYQGTTGASPAVQQPRSPKTPAIEGSQTNIQRPGENRGYSGHYEVRELEDVHASHSGITFQENPAYRLRNDRDYRNAANQGKVVTQAAKFDPSYHVTDNPDSTNGPPILDGDGNALGGNGRAMALQRVYRYNPKGAESYRQLLIKNAERFGIDPANIAGMKKPVLVRVVDDASIEAGGGKQVAVTDFNKKGTAEYTPSERAIADSKMVSQDTLEEISKQLANSGENVTLAEILSGDNGRLVLQRLTEDGVISPNEWASLVGKSGLTDAGKARISNSIVGRFFTDASQMDSILPAIRGKLERLAAPVGRAAAIEGWDLTPTIREAVDMIETARSHGITNLDDLVRQRPMFGETRTFSPQAVEFAKALQSKSALMLVKAMREYSESALGGLFRPKMTPGQAFKQNFRE